MPSLVAKGDWEPSAGPPGLSASNLTFQRVDPTRDSAWDEALSSLAGRVHPTFFHSTAWARVLRESYGYAPLYLLAKRGQRVCGVLPLIEVNSWLTGRRGVSLPFSDECRPLADDAADEKALLEKAIDLGRDRGWRRFESQGGGDCLAADEASLSFYAHALDLQKPPADLFAGFEQAVRRALRKAEREGVQVERSATADALRAYYSLHCQTRKRHGLPPQPWSFFERLHEHVIAREQGFVMLARHHGRPISGAVFVHGGREALYKYSASDLRHQNLRPSNLVLWHAIQWLSQNGFARLSLGRTSTGNEGLRQFKQGWGTTEYKVAYLKFDYRQNRLVRGEDEAYGWHNAVFQRLPGFAARWAGALLYRHWG
jgi:hypothetical protein